MNATGLGPRYRQRIRRRNDRHTIRVNRSAGRRKLRFETPTRRRRQGTGVGTPLTRPKIPSLYHRCRR
jgi:hypothetical protein